MHDPVTRTRGSFEQTLEGLRNASARKAGADLRLVTSTVVHSRNLARLREILDLLSSLDVDAMVLNVVEPSGEALTHFERLVLPYEETAAGIRTALSGFAHKGRVVVEGIPVCLCEGFLECTGMREEIHLLEGGEIRALPVDRNHTKPESCTGCRHTHLCPGVFVEYVKRRGWPP
jgi:cyclic pyranopterin phosphate synthase